MQDTTTTSTLDYASPVAAGGEVGHRSGSVFACFFVAGQFWLFVTLVLWMGEKIGSGGIATFLEIGGYFDSATYGFTVFVCLAIGIALNILAMLCRPRAEK